MAEQSIRVTGLRETIRALEKAGIEAQDLKESFTKIGELVKGESRRQVPVRTGVLQSSIAASKTKNKSVIRAGGAKARWAGVIHYGYPKRNITPALFLTGAIEQKQSESVKLLDEELQKLINKLRLNEREL